MSSSASNPALLLLQSATADALTCLGRTPLKDQAVHDARKALKRARAAIRLLRPVLDDNRYRAANLALRNAGRYLSPLRDARVLLDALDSLARSGADAKTRKLITELKILMRARLSQARRAVLDPDARRHCSNLIKAGRLPFQGKFLIKADADALICGLRRVYRKARKAFLRAREARTTDALHEWRKQLKYLRTAAAILRTSGNHRLRRAERCADEIAAWLGDDHDLAVLCELTREHESRFAATELLALMEERRKKLQHKAFAEGKKVFVRKSRRFTAAVT